VKPADAQPHDDPVLGTAQFVMVLDSTVMNVSISQVVADLHTTMPDVQLAITAYTLVMAA
jgi:predicted MFS family arabinose efflux permease